MSEGLHSKIETGKYENERRQIESLMRTIGKSEDTSVRIGEPGTGNFFAWKERYTQIDPIDLQRNKEEWLGISCHEAKHCAITDWSIIPEEMFEQSGFNQLMQTMEDLRVNFDLTLTHEGAGEWIKQAVTAETGAAGRLNLEKLQESVQKELGYIPYQVRYCVEAQKKFIPEHSTLEYAPPVVQEVMHATEKHIDSIISNLPGKNASDETIKSSASASYQIVKDNIWPEFQKLAQMDQENAELYHLLAHLSTSEGTKLFTQIEADLTDEEKTELDDFMLEILEKEERKSNYVNFEKLSPSLRSKLVNTMKKLESDTKQEIQDKAEDDLKKVEDVITNALRGQLIDPELAETHEEREKRLYRGRPRRVEKEKEEKEYVEKSLGESLKYDDIKNSLSKEIRDFDLRLDDILSPRLLPHWQKGYSTGSRFNLQSAMQFEADRRKYNQLMERLSLPEKPDDTFEFVIDGSGSMFGENILQAYKAAVFFLETFEARKTRDELVIFNELPLNEEDRKRYILKPFDAPLTDRIKKNIETIPYVTQGAGSAYNDDAPSLLWASNRLGMNKGKGNNFLIILSDGQPVPSDKYSVRESDLKMAINQVMQKGDQHLIAIGLGNSGVESVKKFYPKENTLLAPNIHILIPILGNLMEDIVLNPTKYQKL